MNFKNYRIISMQVPKDTLSTCMLFESFLAFVHSLNEVVMLEFLRTDTDIKFYLHIPKDDFSSAIAQLYAIYPNSFLSEISYVDSLNVLASKYLLINCTYTKPSIFPIKRYEQFEDRLSKVVYDPVSSIFEFFNSLNFKNISMSFLLKAERRNFKYNAFKSIYYLQTYSNLFDFKIIRSLFLRFMFSENLLFKLLRLPFCFNAKDLLVDDIKKEHRTESTYESVVDKINKTLFEVEFKFLITLNSEHEKSLCLNSVQSLLKVFEQANLNGFRVKKYKVGDYRLLKKFYTFKKGFVMNSEEISTVFHAPGETVSVSNFSWLNSKKISAPATPLGIVVGKSNYRDCKEKIRINTLDRLRHTYIVGKTGMGKSTLLLNMICQDLKLMNGFCLIDPHGDLVEEVISCVPKNRLNDIILIEPFKQKTCIGLNLMENVQGVDKNIIVGSVLTVFKKLFGFSWGPRLEYILRNFILLLVSSNKNFTLLDLHRAVSDLDFCKKIISTTNDTFLASFFENEFFKLNQTQRNDFVSPILNKLGQFTLNPRISNIVSSPKSTIDFGKCMNGSQVLLINLAKGKLGEDSSSLLGSLLVSKFEIEAMARAKIPFSKRNPFYLYIDEFQNFATESFANILSEARKYSLGLVLANQHFSQMPENVLNSVFGNVGNLISFQVGSFDAELLCKHFSEKVQVDDILSLEKYTAYANLMINGQSTGVFSMKTLNPLKNQKNLKRNLEYIRMNTKQRFEKKSL